MGVPIAMSSGQPPSMQERVAQEGDEDEQSVLDTPTPATRKRKLNAYVVRTKMVDVRAMLMPAFSRFPA